MAASDREYDIIVFGATGYTGDYCAEHVTTHLPTDLKWAIAGRSPDKLERLAERLKQLNNDRAPPAIETCSLDPNELQKLAQKTRVLINTVGPFHKYSTPVVESCAKNGTHYVDVTGETPWVREIISKFHETAKANNTIMIPEIGVESAPADILAWSVVQENRQRYSSGTKEVINFVPLIKANPSGGTLATVFSVFEHYSLRFLASSLNPWSLATVAPSKAQRANYKSISEMVGGVRNVPGLGVMTTSLSGSADAAIVYRSWSLYDSGKFYGPNFRFSGYARARGGYVKGVLNHLVLTAATIFLIFPPFRWLVKRFVYKPGEGPTREETRNDKLISEAHGLPDKQDAAAPTKSTLTWKGSIYRLSGVLLVEAAYVILRSKTRAHELGGGILTPATLGSPLIERLRNAGVQFEVEAPARGTASRL